MGIYNILFIGGLIVCIIFLIATVVLFFVLNIPKVFGVVSGRTEKKAIQEIRESGYEAKSKKDSIHKNSRKIHVRDASITEGGRQTENFAQGSTDNMTKTDNMAQNAMADTAATAAAAGVAAAMAAANEPRITKPRSKRTYDDSDETELLGAEPVPLDGHNEDGTEVLQDHSEEETALLFDTDVAGDIMGNLDDEATDVLAADGRHVASQASYEDATDVLKIVEEAEAAEAAEAAEIETEVLSGTETESVSLTSDDIIGRYSPEETAVLRSADAKIGRTETIGAADLQPAEQQQIRFIYKETVVHTEETLV
ncbi:MAG: hypothetical protein IJ619_04830 [Eubacterium sp.]|nr:hypothetical protein [Eubacterium sp.]